MSVCETVLEVNEPLMLLVNIRYLLAFYLGEGVKYWLRTVKKSTWSHPNDSLKQFTLWYMGYKITTVLMELGGWSQRL